ncbi:cation diffusion facilitator CzcD-associated flavoprotein CzcO [Variovorax boronicumulans]|uniref:Cation diffusion facilitator CzcD-associated flavoprotein CzcO n=1 Tax=Variovorax boronicumulans TaxID=436515 RepID=A0AAW8CXY8_9BURK|nr:NAD(P)/FAD-dependent oxidoreductase [Variovorax boronicumulans]MDP9891860.1 cation diffusion facilitator CzcD-associated flavoprotein CzcO [Variovorax boronicumulans]MDQ0053033.1 cation diffusion facilitator CzcD-associated flavoprotein CzcO [Variovorax boronicumulans]
MADDAPTHEKIALIGAGPSGLAGARNLQKHGVPFQGFEAHSDVGGLWDIDNPRSTVYHSAHLISSKRTTEFAEFPMADTVADYPSHRELRRYFSDFADRFGLREHFRFNTRVLRVEPVNDSPDTRWRVSVDAANGAGGRIETAEYKGVVIANGTLAEPKRPQFEGHFDGELLHTSDYKHAELFRDKRVLIVGAGNSGCDIAVDAVHYAKSVDISVRRGYYFVPKYVFGKPADTLGGKRPLPPWLKQRIDATVLKWFTGDPVRFGFPKPDYRMYESHPIVNSLVLHHVGHGDIGVRGDIARLDGHTVHFKNGSARDYDLILAATGYALHYPFIDRELLNWQGMAPRLYLNIFSPRFENIGVLGMIEASGIGWQGRYEQAELLARYFRAKAAGSPKAAALRAAVQGPPPDLSGGYKYLQLERMAYYVHKDTYRAAVRSASAALADSP